MRRKCWTAGAASRLLGPGPLSILFRLAHFALLMRIFLKNLRHIRVYSGDLGHSAIKDSDYMQFIQDCLVLHF